MASGNRIRLRSLSSHSRHSILPRPVLSETDPSPEQPRMKQPQLAPDHSLAEEPAPQVQTPDPEKLGDNSASCVEPPSLW